MKNFIEELYYGNIDPQNSGFEDDAGVQRELRTISENEDWLTEHLAGEEKKTIPGFRRRLVRLQRRRHLGRFHHRIPVGCKVCAGHLHVAGSIAAELFAR